LTILLEQEKYVSVTGSLLVNLEAMRQESQKCKADSSVFY